MTKTPRGYSLNQRLSKLEKQLERLTDLLAEQASSKRRRRRQLTLRALLLGVLASAILFAWFGTGYRRSLKQSHAVDSLINQGVYVHYSPRQSALVSLLPGEPRSPSPTLVNLFGDDFFRSVTNVSTGRRTSIPRDKGEILKSLPSLRDVERVRLTSLQLTTADLKALEGLPCLQSIDVARTRLDRGAMPWLRSLPLRWLDASHTCFSDGALASVSNCRELQELRLERTCVTDEGLKSLHGMTSLRYLNLKRCPVTAAGVKALADSIPGCFIEWEPLRFFPNGQVDTNAAARGRVRYGRRAPADPREWRRAAAPFDKPQDNVRPLYSGYTIDVF